MGSFFTNVHARAQEGCEVATRDAIVEALTADAAAQGMVVCVQGEEPDRSVVVGPASSWIAIYDDGTEGQDVEALARLAVIVSTATKGHAVSILVHDSDHLLVSLFERGESVDTIARGGDATGDVARWAAVCGPRVDELRRAIARQDLFKEQTVAEIASALGVDPKNACTGYKYLVADEGVPAGSVVLRFRSAVRPAYERPAIGAPRLVLHGMHPIAEVPMGATIQRGISVRNEGGATRGLMVAIHGPAVEANLVDSDHVQIVVGRPNDGGVRVDAALERRTLSNGKPGFVADLPELALPAGNAGGPQALAALGVKAIERMHASVIHANVYLRAIATGTGALFVSFVPLAAREGQVHHPTELSVLPTTRKPLRGIGDPQTWLPLEKPDALVAFAVSSLDASTAAPFAAEAIERWSALWPKDATLSCAIHDPMSITRPSKPRSVKLRVDRMPNGAPWKKLRAALATAARVSAMRTAERKDPMAALRRGFILGDGFDFGGPLFAPQSDSDSTVPTLRLSVDLRDVDDVDAKIRHAQAILDDYVVRARCVQAFAARWAIGMGLDTTAYESACGVHQNAPLRRSWCTRFLRGVSADGMWLGTELLARIDRDALETVASIEPIGDALRVTLREDATLDALEAILAPLLPSADDWKRWMAWMHGKGDAPF